MSGEILSAPRLGVSRAAVDELANRRHEPDWLRALRVRAFDAFERLPLPDQRTDGWRRTNLRGLPLDTINPLGSFDLPSISTEHGHVVDLREALQDARLAPLVERWFGQVVPPETDKFTALHYAAFTTAAVVVVPRGTALTEPIHVRYDFDSTSASPIVHTLLIAEDESDVRLVEEFRGGTGLSSGVVEQVLGNNAHVRYAALQRWAPDVWHFSTQRAQLAQDASLRTLTAALDGRLIRNTVQVYLNGRQAQADLLAIVDTHDGQHVDFQTLQEHNADATRSDLVIHNALRGRSSTNFTGLIRINKTARQTESSQEQKNILLSAQAKADSDPKLEILNNNVIRCTHGASVGPVDPESVFYLQSRGLDRAAAEGLLVEGFFRSVLRKLEAPDLEAAIWTSIDQGVGAPSA